MNYIDNLYFSLSPIARILIAAAVLSVIALISWKKKHLTVSGAIAAFTVGCIILYIGGVSAIGMMMFFFLSSAVIAKVVPHRTGKIQKKGSCRDMSQVLANSVPAVLGLFIYRFTPYEMPGLIAFAASLAEAMSDTWAGDIGVMSRKDPVSIITFTKVPKGLSGGISALGCMASLLASFLMALLFTGCYMASFASLSIITVSGALGALFDSFLGGTLQVHYRRKDGSLTENEFTDGEANERARGLKFMDNDMVNFLSGMFAFTIALTLAFFF